MGSTKSGEELVAGHKNNSQNTTMVLGRSPWNGDQRKYRNFLGRTILLVTPPAPEVKRGFPERYGSRPHNATDGLTAFGCMGGAGVRGIGNQPEGHRGDKKGSGTGGEGVVGHGGTGDLEDSATSLDRDRRRKFNPGIGVLGIGGHWIMPIDDPRGAPGVVGVAGTKGGPSNVPPFEYMRGVGVYGMSHVGNGMHAVGSPTDGTGLVAEGFFGVVATGRSAGVVAFSDELAVNGRGKKVGGRFRGYVGVEGQGETDPGGVFSAQPSERGVPTAQIQAVPQPMWVPDQVQATSYYLTPPDQVGELPQRGSAGQLLMTVQTISAERRDLRPGGEATLWLCVTSGDDVVPATPSQPAIWRQVLLGPAIQGQKTKFKG